MTYQRTKVDGMTIYSPIRIEVVDEDAVSKAMNEIGLAREIKEAVEYMPALRIAQILSENISDTLYLRDVMGQIKFIADGR